MTAAEQSWRLSDRRSVDVSRPVLMGILNLTPDSFSDGGELPTVDTALAAAKRLVSGGATILDVGGESTRPGSAAVSADEQLRRVVPVISAIRQDTSLDAIAITIDTTLAPVAAAALDAGSDAINDVSAGRDDPGMFALAASRRAGIILMHRLAPPARDSYSDRYTAPPDYAPEGGVVAAVREFLAERAAAAEQAGITKGAIVLDPGLGFGKTVEQNLELIRESGELVSLGYPVLSGLSRKSFLVRAAGLPEGTPPKGRDRATAEWSIIHLARGARVFRVHEPGLVGLALAAATGAMAPRAGGGSRPGR